MNRYFALAYAGGAHAVYLVLSALADASGTGSFVFHWWHPALAAFVGSVAIIAPAVYLGARPPAEDCQDCVKAARKYARLETERNELRQALLALEPPK